MNMSQSREYPLVSIITINWNRLEHTLARLDAEFSLQVSGGWAMFTSMLTTQPPGETHIMLDWAVVQVRNHSKVWC